VYKRTIPDALTVMEKGRGIGYMAELSTEATVRPLELLLREGTLGSLTDGQLLERFLASGPAAGVAFDVLMTRHGPMVLGVCRRILRDIHAADDSFQVTFLLLVRRAREIRRRESLGPWLHGVARRVALRARAAAMLRKEREARAAIDSTTGAAEIGDDDLGPMLHAEIDRLPEKYRAPILVCYIQGRTIEEAARQLGWPVGTVGGRLARARDRLRDRLIRRGLFAPAALAAAFAGDSVSAAVVPQALARSTRDAALRVGTGRAATGVASAVVTKLLEETLRHMASTWLMIGAGICGLLGALAIGAGTVGVIAGAHDDLVSRQFPTEAKASPGADRPAKPPLVETLKQASGVADDLTDPEDKLNAHMALAWAQINSGDQASARVSLDHAADAASALEPEPRCYARARIAQARGEAGARQEGLALLAQTRIDAELLGEDRIWPLKSIAVAQSELGDRDAARATIKALDLAILSPEDRLKGRWTSNLSALIEAQLAVGDVEAAFQSCIPGGPREGGKRALSTVLEQQASMLTSLAYAAADANHQSRSGLDPPRPMTADEKAIRLAIVRRAVAAVEALPDPNEHRSSLAASLGELGAFDEAVQVARRIDQKKIQEPREIDAIWALWRTSLNQAKAGNFAGARATLREAARVETPPKADAKEERGRLAYGFVVARGFDEAIKIAGTLDPSACAEILSQVARQNQRDGDRAGADALFRRATMDAGKFLHSPPPRQDKEPSGPVPADRENGPEKRAAIDPKVTHEAEALSLLAMIHARAGNWASAERTFASISPENQQKRVTAFRISSVRARSGDVAGALAWARSLPSSSLRAWAIRGLAVGILGDEFLE
jgi:RNA polymerase sigma factor (sigma-70 family)